MYFQNSITSKFYGISQSVEEGILTISIRMPITMVQQQASQRIENVFSKLGYCGRSVTKKNGNPDTADAEKIERCFRMVWRNTHYSDQQRYHFLHAPQGLLCVDEELEMPPRYVHSFSLWTRVRNMSARLWDKHLQGLSSRPPRGTSTVAAV
eukprot:Filipodium_phascolosomae@DN2558_c0_g1_i2.p1